MTKFGYSVYVNAVNSEYKYIMGFNAGSDKITEAIELVKKALDMAKTMDLSTATRIEMRIEREEVKTDESN